MTVFITREALEAIKSGSEAATFAGIALVAAFRYILRDCLLTYDDFAEWKETHYLPRKEKFSHLKEPK